MQSSSLVTVELAHPLLRRRSRDLAILLESADQLMGSRDLRQVHQIALEQFIKYFKVDAARLYTRDQGGYSLAASLGVDPRGLETVRVDQGFTGECVRARRLVAHYISELPDSQRVNLLIGKGFKIVICIPLITLDQVVGVINLNCRREIKLDPRTIDLMILFGHRLAVLSDHARLVGRLREQTEMLKQQQEALQYFTFTAFHDLKSPTVGLLGLTRRLSRKFKDQLGAKGAEYCRQIMRAASRVEALVRELNLYMRARDSRMDMEDVDLTQVLEELRRDFALRLEERGIKLELPARAPRILGHRLGLGRIFQNLVDNALMHGGESLTAIRVEIQEQGEGLLVRVGDDGRAIPPREVERLFAPFERLVHADDSESTGLGLAIVREMVKRHGGRIWVESPPQGGVKFCFTLAVNPGDAAEKPEGPPPA